MTTVDIGLYVLTGLAIVGLVALGLTDKATTVIVPVLTALIGIIAGKKGEVDAGVLGIGKK